MSGVDLSTKGLISAGGGDLIAPVITIISPTPDTPPGEPGGFPSDFGTAKDIPIVLRVTDVSPGNQYICIVAIFEDDTQEIVFRRGAFHNAYVTYSTSTDITDGLELSVRRVGGWPSGLNRFTVGTIRFEIDAIDQAGNLAP